MIDDCARKDEFYFLTIFFLDRSALAEIIFQDDRDYHPKGAGDRHI